METFVAFWETQPHWLSSFGPLDTVRGPGPQPVSQNAVDSGEFDDELIIQRSIGAGGMGKVDLAVQTSLERSVAVKRAGVSSPLAFQALIREARIVGALEHPNIVPVHGLRWNADGEPMLVMKRIEGVEWSERLRDPATGRPAPQIGDALVAHLEILLQVCNAIEFAHSRRVLHRDIKPNNVMVGAFGEVVVLDWGIALRLDEAPSTAAVGTPAYMAPEMVRGSTPLSERTDVYLLGATLHEVITGECRHRGSSVQDVLEAAWESAPPTFPASVPQPLAAIVTRATAALPEERYSSVAEFRVAIAEFLEHRLSLESTRATWARLASLPAASERQRHRELIECRFAFEQALRAYPENAEAQAGAEQCLDELIQLELDRRNVEAAQELIDEHPHASPRTLARFAEVCCEIVDLRTAGTKWQRLQANYNPEEGRAARLVLVWGLGLYVVVASLLWMAAERSGWMVTTPARSAGMVGVGVVLALAGAVWMRLRRTKTALHKTFTEALVVYASFLFLNHLVVGAIGGAALSTLWTVDLLLASFASLGMSFILHRNAPWIPMLYALGAMVAAMVPAMALPLFVSGFFIEVLSTLWQGARPTFSEQGWVMPPW